MYRFFAQILAGLLDPKYIPRTTVLYIFAHVYKVYLLFKHIAQYEVYTNVLNYKLNSGELISR